MSFKHFTNYRVVVTWIVRLVHVSFFAERVEILTFDINNVLILIN